MKQNMQIHILIFLPGEIGRFYKKLKSMTDYLRDKYSNPKISIATVQNL